ncbi:MAG: F0F1 ATP synthase subunit A [Fimbriimonadaceae bacterium]|nr:F0F1 ATP synthase subunit A [Fimbriimonadaceae bacterium]
MSYAGLFIYLLIVLAVIFGSMAMSKSGLNAKVIKNPIAQLYEQLYLFIENMTVGIIGGHGRRYIPMMMTIWLVVFVSNMVSLFFPAAPSGDLSFNIALALVCVGYVQWEGMKANGVFGHFGHFAGPKLGLALIPITLMIFVIEIISEVMKNVSLSLRLFGNIHGGHEAVVKLNEIGAPIYVPLGFFLLPIKFLTCIVQALIFTLLTCVYISLVTHHEEEHGGHDEGHGEMAHAH